MRNLKSGKKTNWLLTILLILGLAVITFGFFMFIVAPFYVNSQITPTNILSINDTPSSAWEALAITYENINYTPKYVGKDLSWFFPIEENFNLNPKNTIERGYGICTQRSILACSYARYYGFDCWVKVLFTFSSSGGVYAHAQPCVEVNGTEKCL